MKIRFSSTIYIAIAVATFVASCDKKINEAYINPNAGVKKPVETLLPGIIGNMVGSSAAAGSAYGVANDGLYVGRYIQYWATNTTGNQYDQMGGATGASDILGSVWAMHYFGMGHNLGRMIDWGIEDKKWDYVGVGYAIRAWSQWLNLTNMYGEVILREAFDPTRLTFKYEDQKEVYDTVRALCHRALTYLNMTGDGVDPQNLQKGDAYFYNGDINKWKKFVYSVLARSYNQLSNKAEYKPDSVIFYCNLAINDNADNATAKFANTGVTGTSNFYGPYRSNVGALRQTVYITNLLTGLNSRFPGAIDPRVSYLLRENRNGTYRGILPNKATSGLVANDRPAGYWGQGFDTTTSPTADTGRYIFKNGVPFPIITASEVKFMKAEAYFRKGDKAAALAAYQEGISLNFDMLTTAYNSNIRAGREITAANKAAYLANPVVVPAAANLTLSHIMLQKYIALYGFGLIETWVDMRRYHYTDLEGASQVYADFIPPSGIDLFINNGGKLVFRARPRYNSEYLYNIDELDRLGGLALDYNTKEQWFSQK